MSEQASKLRLPGSTKEKDRQFGSLIHKALALVCLALASFPAQSDTYGWQKSIRFENITPEQGLPATRFMSVTQDKYGFMWFATDIGLVRYDGYRFTMYQNDPDDPASLLSNTVHTVYVDSQDTLWVGMRAGLSRYNHHNESFTNFRHDPESSASLGANVVQIYEDREGVLWLGHYTANNWSAGLSAFDRQSGSFTRYRHDPDNSHSLPLGSTMAIQEDRSGELWVGTWAIAGGSGLARFDRKTNSFYRFPDCYPEQSQCPQPAPGAARPPDFRTGGIHEDQAGNLWFNGSGSGLIKYDRQSNIYKRFICDPENPDARAVQPVAGNIVEDDDGHLWFNDRSLGLTSFDPVTGKCSQYLHDPADSNSIGFAPNNFLSLYQDNNEVVWVTGTTDNLSKFDPNSLALGFYKFEPPPPADASVQFITSLVEEKDGLLWVGCLEGLRRVDRASGNVMTFRHDPSDPESLHSEYVTALYIDLADTLWIGTKNGLSRFNKITEKFQYYPIDPSVTDPDIARSNDVVIGTITEDAEGYLWLGTSTVVSRFNPSTGEVINYRADPDKPDTLRGDLLLELLIDIDGTVWIGSTTGLNHLDPRSQEITQYVHDPKDPNSINPGQVHRIVQDQTGNIWIGTSLGLDRFDPVSGVFAHMKDSKGNPLGGVDQIIPDGRGYLWVDTNDDGFSRFNPTTGETRSFNESNGLSGKTGAFSYGGILSANGEMIIATDGGINIFDPDDLPDYERKPIVILTDFLLHNEPVAISTPDQETPLPASIYTTPEITMTYKDYLFSFEFAAPGYKYPKDLRYAYTLEGFDKDWIETGADRRIATYTSVPPGDYLLHIKAAGRDTDWNENHTTIKVRILPPWWQTWWAYGFYVVAFFLVLFTYIRIRTLSLTRRASLLKKTVKERTAQITQHQQHIQHQAEDLEELLHLKEKLITNISHEFRTPLTLILAPAKRMLRRTKDGSDHAHLETIRRNAQRLLRLVDQLLGMARLGAEESQERSSQAVTTTAIAITDSFQPLAKEKGLQLTLENNHGLWVCCAPDTLEKILLNLISNAIKYTPTGGQIKVACKLNENDMVELSVSDTGIGIPEDEQKAVFERFHRVGDSGEKIPGAGIGLALVKELVETHNGHVHLSSSQGVGTTVTVTLPSCTPNTMGRDTDKQVTSTEAIELEVETLSTPIAGPEAEPIDETNEKALVLIVEDNVDMQHYLVEILSDVYQCAVANDGEQALEVAFEHIPDLVLLDVMMPKMDGFQVSHALKEDERTSHIPIIMLTARHDRDSRMESWQEKVDGYLTKPFDDEELRLRIANLLEIRDILKSRFSTAFFEEIKPHQVINEKENGFLKKLEKLLEQRHSNPDFGLAEIASEMFMSPRQLQRKLKAITGQHPAVFLRSYRLRKARGLLKSGMQVGITADAVGFSSPAYFTSCFKAQFGKTPTEYR